MPNAGQQDRFQRLYADSGFWSCCGYDGLSVAFDVPLEAIRSLHEGRKQALIRLITRLANTGDDALLNELQRLDSLSGEERLAGLVELSAPFLP
jgi:hypothetical protein